MRRFFRLFAIDVREGCLRQYGCLALMVGVAAVCSAALSIRVGQAAWQCPATLGDRCAAYTMGSSAYFIGSTEPFDFPIEWACVAMTLLYVTLRYPLHSLANGGDKVLVSSGSRRAWLLSKVLWVVCQALMFFGIFFMMAVLFCLLEGGSLSFTTSSNLVELYRYSGMRASTEGVDVSAYCLVAAAVLLALCLLQLALSVVAHPIVSFGAMAALLFAAAFFNAPFLLGNFSMALRSSCFMAGGLSLVQGALYSALVSAVALVAAFIVFSRYDAIDERFE